jgi:hypothetical protein
MLRIMDDPELIWTKKALSLQNCNIFRGYFERSAAKCSLGAGKFL